MCFSVAYDPSIIILSFIKKEEQRGGMHNNNYTRKTLVNPRNQDFINTKAILFYGYAPIFWKWKPSSVSQALTRNWKKKKMFTFRWIYCITIMKWESWENKQLIHYKCKTTLYKTKATIKLMGHGLWMHCSGFSRPKDSLKTII